METGIGIGLEKGKAGFFTTKNVVALTTLVVLGVTVYVGGGILKDWAVKKINEMKKPSAPAV